ncbi:MAG: 2-keto-3-deoxygluconate permease [Erysipelotrichaceae bacterium]
MNLLKTIKRIPAGTMIVPLFIAAFIHTFFPDVLAIGGYTSAIATNVGLNTLMGLTLLFTGTQMKLSDLFEALKRGGSHVLFKYIVGAAFYLLVLNLFGLDGIFGVCSLAILCALTNCNGSLYMGLMETYGDNADLSARPMFNINSGPMLSLVTIGLSGAATFNWIDFVAILLPVIVGLILANIDPNIATATKNANAMILPVLGFVLGSSINLLEMIKAGSGGIILFLIVIIVSGPVALLVDRLILKRPGYAGLATVSVAGNTLAVPAAIALLAPEYAPYVQLAVIQISGAVILSALIMPIVVHYYAKKFGCPKSNELFNDGSCSTTH